MKLKKFIAISFTILIVSTVFLEITPYLQLISARSGFQTAGAKGTFVEYEFNDGGIYSYINGTPTLLQQTGVIKLSYNDNNSVSVGIAISSPKLIGTPNGFNYTPLYHNNETFNMSNLLIQNFINSEKLILGNIVSIDNSRGVVNNALPTSYSVQITNGGKPTNLNTAAIGHTNPKVVNLTSVKEGSNPGFSPYENYFEYDHSGSYNILVSASMLAGTIGISPFLKQLLSNTNINKPILNVTGFSLGLINTNINLSPVAMSHYFTKYFSFIAVIWILGGAYVAITVRTTMNRRQKANPGPESSKRERRVK